MSVLDRYQCRLAKREYKACGSLRQNCNVKEHFCAMAQLRMHKHYLSSKLIALLFSLIQPIGLAGKDFVSIRAPSLVN